MIIWDAKNDRPLQSESIDITGLTVRELQEKLKELGIPYAKMTKAELQDKLREVSK